MIDTNGGSGTSIRVGRHSPENCWLDPLQFGVPAECTDERFPFQALHPPARIAVAVQHETGPQVGQGADDISFIYLPSWSGTCPSRA